MLTTNLIAKKALPILQENLVFPALVTLDYSNVYAKKGDTIQVKRPSVFVADEFDSAISTQSINPYPVLVKMDKIADVSVEVSAKELALELDDFTEDVARPAIIAIAEKINRDGLDLYKYVGAYTGASGSTPDSLADISNGAKGLDDAKVPTANRYAVWNTEAMAKFRVLDALVGLDKSGSTEALRAGSIGDVFGVQNFMTQAVKTHTAGAFAYLDDVTAAADISADNATDATTGLKYTSVVLTSDAGASTAKLLKGDLLSFADDSGNVHQVAVMEDSASAASGVVTVKVIPQITQDDVTDTAVTFPDETAKGHVANLVFHKSAFGFVTRPLEPASGADSSVETFGGLSIRVVMDYDISSKSTTMSFDVLYGYAPLYPELAVRVLG